MKSQGCKKALKVTLKVHLNLSWLFSELQWVSSAQPEWTAQTWSECVPVLSLSLTLCKAAAVATETIMVWIICRAAVLQKSCLVNLNLPRVEITLHCSWGWKKYFNITFPSGTAFRPITTACISALCVEMMFETFHSCAELIYTVEFRKPVDALPSCWAKTKSQKKLYVFFQNPFNQKYS